MKRTRITLAKKKQMFRGTFDPNSQSKYARKQAKMVDGRGNMGDGRRETEDGKTEGEKQ